MEGPPFKPLVVGTVPIRLPLIQRGPLPTFSNIISTLYTRSYRKKSSFERNKFLLASRLSNTDFNIFQSGCGDDGDNSNFSRKNGFENEWELNILYLNQYLERKSVNMRTINSVDITILSISFNEFKKYTMYNWLKFSPKHYFLWTSWAMFLFLSVFNAIILEIPVSDKQSGMLFISMFLVLLGFFCFLLFAKQTFSFFIIRWIDNQIICCKFNKLFFYSIEYNGCFNLVISKNECDDLWLNMMLGYNEEYKKKEITSADFKLWLKNNETDEYLESNFKRILRR